MADRVPIAVAVLIRDGQVLLAHRHQRRRWYPDCWDLVGGHVEAGETPEEAVRRECGEELGVEIHDPAPVPLLVDDPTLRMHAFLVTRWDGEVVNAAPAEHDDLRWVSPDELPGLTLVHPGVATLVRSVAGPPE
ncbi:NUDIX domain-containing protein [uncultured Nocardioides sp.]|uniref:NUDIX domain-containing protein n=1 Tax=uncultured Nocardioides sp. TaxID=198441 RepID=UPI0026191B73|nr:NUDIX domain-containing protein [uncultured Nocardioides sp.]